MSISRTKHLLYNSMFVILSFNDHDEFINLFSKKLKIILLLLYTTNNLNSIIYLPTQQN